MSAVTVRTESSSTLTQVKWLIGVVAVPTVLTLINMIIQPSHTSWRYAPIVANVPPDCATAGAAGQCAGWACGASRRRAPTPARRDQNAPRQPCRTMPACIAPAFLWGSCVCVRWVTRSSTSTTCLSCSQSKLPTPKLTHKNFIHNANHIGSRKLRQVAGIPDLYNPPGQLNQISPNGPADRQVRLRHRLAQNLSEAQLAPYGPFFRLRQSAASYASHFAALPASSERV